ncbi:MAG TPA: hypothetical protein VI461_02470 [Chitinophagaceae bacterium]|nr:hypothetical protein [Chitinophagaceae bacterium]
MRTMIIFIICIVSILMMTNAERRKGDGMTPAAVSFNIDTNYFKTTIQPILQKNCTPCHFTGGKMYEKMPFDKGETIMSHEAGIVKRIKNEDELTLIKQFIRQSR